MKPTASQRQTARLWTPSEVSEYLQLSKSTIYQWAADGTLPAIILSQGPRKRTFRFDPTQIEKWVRSRETWTKGTWTK